MPKFITLFTVLILAGLLAAGCAKKENSAESMEMTIPMSISVDGKSSINMATKEGLPVETSAAQMPENTQEASFLPSNQDIQMALKNAGFYKGAIDGKIGPASKKALTEFQQQNGLTADGKAGKKTWEKLKSYLNQAQQ